MLFYFVGIKGSGMAALAQILKDEGHEVKGLDTENYVFTEQVLHEKNIVIENFHNYDFKGVDFFIVGHSFINHEIITHIKKTNIPCLEYHIFISKYFEDKYQIAISGTHGKTTTVGLFKSGLEDVTKLAFLCGDGSSKGGTNTTHFVYEACEYLDHFLSYKPQEIIITNIDYDHVDYFLTREQYIESFQKFANNATRVYILEEDAHLINHPGKITFGLSSRADCYFERLDLTDGLSCDFFAFDRFIAHVELPVYGQYNALHVLAVLTLSICNSFDIRLVLDGLANFSGVKRRLEHKIISDDVFIDDYAHHPKEIEATIASLRLMYPSHKVVVIFKPDRISRLLKFKDEFITALHKADQSYVLPLYEHLNGQEQNSSILQSERILCVKEPHQIANETNPENRHVFIFMSSKNLDNEIYKLDDLLRKKR